MRALDRLISFVFSVLMLVLSIILILVGVGTVDSQMIIDMLNKYVFAVDTKVIFNPLTITGIVLLLLSLKTTIFLSLFRVKDKSPILVKTKNGEIEIAQETITNTVRNVGLSFDNIKDIQAKMVKKSRGVKIYAMIMVHANTNIRETTENLQEKVKEVVKNTTGVTVLEVNIKVKNIYQKQRTNSAEEQSKKVEQPIEENVEENAKENIEAKEDVTTETTENQDVVQMTDTEDSAVLDLNTEEVDPNQISLDETK